MKHLRSILIAIAAVLVLASCSHKVLTGTEVVKTRDRILTDTLVKVHVHVPVKEIKVDTTLKSVKIKLPAGTKVIKIVKENKDMRVEVLIDSLGRVKIDARTKADSLETVIKLQKEKIIEQTNITKTYMEKETWFKKTIRNLGIGLACVVLGAVILLFIIYRIKKKLPIP